MITLTHSDKIFDILSRGQFICANSREDNSDKLYNIIDNEANFDDYYDYFLGVGFFLEKGDGYYYFAKKELKNDIERKIEAAYKWIDIVDFFKTFDDNFGVGFRFTPVDIESKLSTNTELKSKLNNLREGGRNNTDSIAKIIASFKDDFIELENEITSQYKVLDSFRYLEQLILIINITEEEVDETPE